MQAVAQKPGRLVLHPAWIAFAALALGVPMGALMFRQVARPELPVLAQLTGFSLPARGARAGPAPGLLPGGRGRQGLPPRRPAGPRLDRRLRLHLLRRRLSAAAVEDEETPRQAAATGTGAQTPGRLR